MAERKETGEKFLKLVDIMKTLRGKNGCPWDREQTRHSLKPYLLEETYEVLEALDQNNDEMIKEELGDLLLQIIFHAGLAEDEEKFSIGDVLDEITAKLIHRHPHVYKDLKLTSSRDVLANWNQLKHAEKKTRSKERESILGKYPKDLPLLHKALRITDKASKAGFDWPNVESVLAKIEEEFIELKTELSSHNKEGIENEIGDLLFAIVNLARISDINPEIALRGSLGKFISRFHYIEKCLEARGLSFSDCDLNILEGFWNEAKNKV